MTKLTMFICISFITLLSGCGGTSKTLPKMVTGTFIDDPVQGLDYQCTSDSSGQTNARGEYICEVGDRVSFSLKGITIGTTAASSTFVTPYTFFPENLTAAINLARLLQTLDIDGDADNGLIQLDPNQNLPPQLDFTSANFDTEVAIELVSASIAIQRLNDNIVKNGGTVPETATQQVDTTAPTSPTLLSSLLTTDQDTLPIEISGESGATIWMNSVQQGTIDENGKGAVTLNTSGEDGNKAFNITLKDSSNNESSVLLVNVTKKTAVVIPTPDTVAPAITVSGDNPASIYQGIGYTDAGATALDAVDGVVAVTTTGTVDISKPGTYTLTYSAIDKAKNEATKTRIVNVVLAPDTTAPATPSLQTTILATNQDTLNIEISGEAATSIWINNTQQSNVAANGKGTITLDTSGEDGSKLFSITLKDVSDNESDVLTVNVSKDTVAPDTNAKVSSLQTADPSPALSGQLPSGENDTDTTGYTIKLLVNGEEYEAMNNADGSWQLPANTFGTLGEGFYTVTVITTDAAGNTSSTLLTNALEINNSGFLIDSALEGIKYMSGKYSGYTDKNGLFKYENDQDVRFYIGDESTGIELGATKVKSDPFASRKIVTIFDLAGSQDEKDATVINMGRFLQSLDSDNDVSNGILIDERSKESIALLGLKNRITFNISPEEFAAHSDIESLFNDLAGHFGEHRGLISIADTQAHLVSVRDNTLPVQKYGLETTRGDKKETVISTGVFQSTNGVVEGIDYRSGNQFGRTNNKGEFSYEEGSTIKFSIYELVLGTTQSKAVITPADMVRATSFNHPKPRNIIRLLNAFDAISNDEKVSIDQAVRDALEKYRSQIDLNLPDGRANDELGISKRDDEFGAQFEDFELGQEILNEVSTLRSEG